MLHIVPKQKFQNVKFNWNEFKTVYKNKIETYYAFTCSNLLRQHFSLTKLMETYIVLDILKALIWLYEEKEH